MPQPGIPANPRRTGKVVIAVALFVVVAVFLALAFNPRSSPFSGVRDSDNDGVPDEQDPFPDNPGESRDADSDGVGDSQDAFPTDPTQWSDRDGDGYGDNSNGNNPDAFPDDPQEARDSDRDGIGDSRDIFDSGNGGVRIQVTYLAVGSDCDFWTACDPFFRFGVDANEDGNYECTRTSGVFQDVNVLSNPSSAYILCDIPDGDSSIRAYVQVLDSDVTGEEAIDYTSGSGSYYIYTINTPFSANESESGDGSSGYAAQLSWSVQVTSA